MIKTIYIAGPYTSAPEKNTWTAILYGHQMLDVGLMPFIPHLSHYMEMIHHRHYEEWMAMDFVWLEKCDALFRIPGESSGADREVARAQELGIPVFVTVEELMRVIGKG